MVWQLREVGNMLIGIVVFLIVTLLSPTTVHAQSAADWYMAGANPERTSSVTTQVDGGKSIDWFAQIEAYIPDYVQLVTANNMVYVATARGVYALDAATGTTTWRYDTELPIGNSPTVVGQVAYFGGFDKKIHAVNAVNGNQIWEFTGGTAPFTTSPVVVNNKVYVGGRDGYFYALNTSRMAHWLGSTHKLDLSHSRQSNFLLHIKMECCTLRHLITTHMR